MLRPTLSYANVMSSVAVFIALGGTGYAVTKLPRNSVGATQLKANAVTSSKIRARAVQRSDLAPSARIAARGPRGADGPAGTAGAQGSAGPSETIQVRPSATVQIPNGARSPATLASVSLSSGSWLLDGRATVVHDGPAIFYDCFLRTAAGATLGIETAHVGTDAAGSLGIEVAVQSANELAVPTQVLFTCEGASATSGDARGYYVSLLATRIGRVENR